MSLYYRTLDVANIDDGDVYGVRLCGGEDVPIMAWLELSHRVANGQIGLSRAELIWLLGEMDALEEDF